MDRDIEAAARRHGLSLEAADVLYRALMAGDGRQAQFDHPELGGMGQWSGGMTQIGAMFDDALKARVGGFCQELSATTRKAAESSTEPREEGQGPRAGHWWSASLGSPASSGAQDGLRYACFPDKRRLAVERNGQVTLYDTGHHRLTGVSQQQGGPASLLFSGPDGPVPLDTLALVSE